MNEDQLRSNFDAVVTEVRRLRDGIEEHRDRVLQRERNGAFIHRGTHAQSPNERLWELLDGAT